VANTPNPETQSDAISGYPTISADGHYVVFISAATNLAPGTVGNGHTMVYLAKTGF
jgi:Tol biopolymer transport system component